METQQQQQPIQFQDELTIQSKFVDIKLIDRIRILLGGVIYLHGRVLTENKIGQAQGELTITAVSPIAPRTYISQ